MNSRRLVASAALCAAVLLGATGCNFIAPQATTITYSASDGVNVPASGPLEVRNALIVATEDGKSGNLIAAIVNATDKAETLSVQIEGSAPLTLRVPAHTTASLGANEEPLLIERLNVKPGATVEVYFQSGSATGAALHLPVLDGTLPEYADLVPDTKR